MRIVRLEEVEIKEVVECLEGGGIIIYPTETVYGLGGNALDEEVVRRIYRIKQRGKKPISIAFSDVEMVKEYVEWNEIAERIAKEFLPGPLTLILPKKFDFPFNLTWGSERIGVRIPENAHMLEIIRKFGKPITSTSANISGRKSPVTVEEAIAQIGEKVDLIIDGGKCKYGVPSTIIKIDKGIKILREGPISKEEIERVLD